MPLHVRSVHMGSNPSTHYVQPYQEEVQPESSIAVLQSTASLDLELPLTEESIPETAGEGDDPSTFENPGLLQNPFASASVELSGAFSPAQQVEAGQPSSTSQLSPAPSLLTARSHSLVVRSGVEVYAFGRGDCAQLGTGQLEDSPNPQPLPALKNKDIVSVAASEFHGAAVSGDGEL